MIVDGKVRQSGGDGTRVAGVVWVAVDGDASRLGLAVKKRAVKARVLNEKIGKRA